MILKGKYNYFTYFLFIKCFQDYLKVNFLFQNLYFYSQIFILYRKEIFATFNNFFVSLSDFIYKRY